MILGFFELPKDEQPPDEIWLNDEEIAAHFERIDEARDARVQGMEPIDETPLVQNELTRTLR